MWGGTFLGGEPGEGGPGQRAAWALPAQRDPPVGAASAPLSLPPGTTALGPLGVANGLPEPQFPPKWAQQCSFLQE